MRILVISDAQIPLHHMPSIKNIMKMLKREKFDMVLNCGDELDMSSQSKWSKGTADEWAGKLDEERSIAQDILWELGPAYGIETHITRSNHTDRLYHTLLRGAPSLIGLPELDYPKFMQFEELNIKFHKKPFEFAPGMVLVHGDEGSMNRNAGLTALGLARKFGKSVVCGHTHRLGFSAESRGIGGDYNTLWGLEAGNLMDKKKAGYLKAGAGNWQMGIAVLDIKGKSMTPTLIHINKDGSFVFNRKLYS